MKTFEQLVVGEYYVPVFKRDNPTGSDFHEQYNTNSPIYKYLGGLEFVCESGDGEAVEHFFDPEIGVDVSTDSPDGFVQ